MKSAKTKKRKTAKTERAAAPVTHTPKKSRNMVENLHEILPPHRAHKESLAKLKRKQPGASVKGPAIRTARQQINDDLCAPSICEPYVIGQLRQIVKKNGESKYRNFSLGLRVGAHLFI